MGNPYRVDLADADSGVVLESRALTFTEPGNQPGGSTPAGSDGQIQFNDADVFGASPHFVWDDAGRNLILNNDENGVATIKAGGAGCQAVIEAADAAPGGQGGQIQVTSGTGDGGDGGDILIAAGDDVVDGSGGSVAIASGSSDADNGSNGGDIDIRANPTHMAGFHGGNVNVVAGAGAFSGGGHVTIQGGLPDGNVRLYSSNGSHSVELQNNGLHIIGPAIGFYSASPVAQQTGVAVTAAAIHAALVNLGLITA